MLEAEEATQRTWRRHTAVTHHHLDGGQATNTSCLDSVRYRTNQYTDGAAMPSKCHIGLRQRACVYGGCELSNAFSMANGKRHFRTLVCTIYRYETTNYELRTTNYELRTTNYVPQQAAMPCDADGRSPQSVLSQPTRCPHSCAPLQLLAASGCELWQSLASTSRQWLCSSSALCRQAADI